MAITLSQNNLLVPDAGTAASPTLGFQNSSNSGLFLKADSVIGVSVGGTEVTSFTSTGISQTSQKYIMDCCAKVGTTAGWVVGAANNLGLAATIPAGQTASTLVVPVKGFKVGWTITSFHLIGQIESAGNAAVVDADLRKLTAAAADIVDASIGAITQLSVTADTIMSATNTSKVLVTPEVIAADETFYVLITSTTAAATDIALQGVAVVFTTA